MADDKEVIRALQRQLDQLAKGINRLSGDREVILFGNWARIYMALKLENPTLRDSTKRAFEQCVRLHLVPAFDSVPLEEINNTKWLQWVLSCRSGILGKTITRFFMARKVLIEILNAAKAEGFIEKIPKLDNPDESRNVGRALADWEVLKIIKNTKLKLFRLIFYVFWKMGCRPREILQWEWSMFEWKEPGHTWIEIPSRISKTVRTRNIPVNPIISRRLAALYKRGNGSIFVFPKIGNPNTSLTEYSHAWRAACEKAGIEAVPYDLRRTFITRCAAEGKPLIYVAKMLDTSTKMIESVYAKAQVDVMEGIIK